MKKLITGLLMVAATTILLAVPDNGEAMPGFARKYRFSCNVCHSPFPRLKPYGDEFAANGFRLPEGEPPRVSYDTGDALMYLPRDLMLGMRLDMYMTYNYDDPTSEYDLKTPWNAKIISGGPISDKVSYYLYFLMSEHGEIAGLEDAFLYFNDVFETGANFTVGQFAVSDPIAKAELRLTMENYALFARKPDRSYTNLKYDRGVILDYGFDFGLSLSASAVNGNGIGEAADDTYDNDNFTNYFFRVAQEAGPAAVGGFYYFGKERNTPADASTDYQINDLEYYGGDLTLYWDTIELKAVYLVRMDSNPHFMEDDDVTRSHGWLGEMVVSPQGQDSRIYFVAMYNEFYSEYELDEVQVMNYQSATGAVNYLVARNVKLVAEYTCLFRDYSDGKRRKDENKYMVGVVAAF